jgi:hypothetical protein
VSLLRFSFHVFTSVSMKIRWWEFSFWQRENRKKLKMKHSYVCINFVTPSESSIKLLTDWLTHQSNDWRMQKETLISPLVPATISSSQQTEVPAFLRHRTFTSLWMGKNQGPFCCSCTTDSLLAWNSAVDTDCTETMTWNLCSHTPSYALHLPQRHSHYFSLFLLACCLHGSWE